MSLERLMTYVRKWANRLLIVLLSLQISWINVIHVKSAESESCPVYSIGQQSGHMIALTFDDGPHPKKTPEILDILKQNSIPATFFVVGENAAENEEIVERIYREGHEIGNHTLTHKYLHDASIGVVEREIDLCDHVIFNHSEYNSIVFRPPGGLYDADLTTVCSKRGYSVVLWSIDTRDWAGTSALDICKEIYNNVEDGSIILMHDYVCGESHTAEALRIVIPELKKLGYRFVTVSELIGN
jgi:peptidoglycan/xylan/chitin deacetylase (PgdA/CDA1 family)